MMAASVTLRAIGPPRSKVMEIGMMPWRETSPSLGLKPTRLFLVDGLRIDEPVSVPVPTCANNAAMAAPVPALEPPGIFSRL